MLNYAVNPEDKADFITHYVNSFKSYEFTRFMSLRRLNSVYISLTHRNIILLTKLIHVL